MANSFDIRNDAPNQLRYEALTMSLKFERTSETTGRVSWNIPTPAAGCNADTQAYNGIVVTIDNTPADASKIPQKGVAYESDPTADQQLHAGDKIGTSLVIGAYYDDKTTTFFDVTGLKPNTPYYVSGYPVDAQYRYFIEGIHAYSLDSSGVKTEAKPTTVTVKLTQSDGTAGVRPDDATGLVCGIEYELCIVIGEIPPTHNGVPANPSDCTPVPNQYVITIDGCNAITYQDLVDEINTQLGKLKNCPQSPYPPNAGTFYWNPATQQLFQWDGYQHNPLPVIVEPTQPNIPIIGAYWLNTTTNILYQWNGTMWVVIPVLTFTTDPTQPICDVTVWYDGTTARRWNGVAWCEITSYSGTSDPSQIQPAPCGSYWFNTTNETMYKWDDAMEIWIATVAVKSTQNPNTLAVGSYWFDTTSNTLFELTLPGPAWTEPANVRISETTPSMPGPGTLWYNPATQVLQQYIAGVWTVVECIVFAYDPRNRTTCDLWWDSANDLIYVWDTVTSTWKQAPEFFNQATDPTFPPSIPPGTIWINTGTGLFYSYDNYCWVQIEVINYPTDPITTIASGTVWYNGTSWYVWNGLIWTEINPIQYGTDPFAIAAGTYWFNTTNDTLQVWNGLVWVNLMYVTTPLTPTKGTCWYNNLTGKVMEWDGTTWVEGTSPAYVEIDCYGNLLFSSGLKGVDSYINTPSSGCGNLFSSLNATYNVMAPVPGVDADDGAPMYEKLGVGTDGSADERRNLITEIRFQLGYPVVDVELTEAQLDYYISKAVSEFRQRASAAYRQGFFFLPIAPETQVYKLTSSSASFNKIVQVIGVYRLTSAFLSSAHGAGVYGQIVLQHLYNMGTFDLLSYHIIAEYVELMEMLFAGRITFNWNEQKRTLHLHHRFPFAERMVLVEASVERTEQDLMSDRYTYPWIRRFALAQARIGLAEIRGKYATLPGAGGGVSLNAAELRAAGVEELNLCYEDLKNYVADTPEEFGLGTTMILG